MSNKDKNDQNYFTYPGMKKKVMVKTISLVKGLLEAQEAVSSDNVNMHEKPNKFFGFLFKPMKTHTQSAAKIVEAYIN